jgi:ATP-binding cassette subfamily B protein
MVNGADRRGELGRFFRGQLSLRWRLLALAFVSLMGGMLMDLLAPWPVKIVIDHVLLQRPLPASMSALQPLLANGPVVALAVLAACIAGIAMFSGAFAYAQSYLSARVGYELVHALRRELFSHLQRLSLSFHMRSRSGELLTKVSADTNLLREALSDWAVKSAADVLLLAGVLVVMFLMNWRLALVVGATLPLLFLAMMQLNRRIRLSARAQRKQEGRLVSRLNEVLGSMPLVQAFGRERYEEERFDAESAQSLDAGLVNARMAAAMSRLLGVVAAIGLAATVMVGGAMAVKGQMSPGDLLIFLAYVNGLYKPIRDLGKISAKFSRARASAERVDEILSLEPEIRDSEGAIPVHALRGAIEFDNVSFAYDDSAPVLRGIRLRIEPGEHVALIGPSGSGKSTLASLILRLYDPDEGSVRIDGVAVDRYARESLRQRIGIVLQDTVLTGASIADNIAYGRPDASSKEIEAAARLASAHGFIVALPEGYDAIVGERGCMLSGGQRQRLCLARALIKSPDVLILDEPTAAIDSFTAGVIDQAIATTRRGRTTIVIGHQFSALESFDRIFEVSHGSVREVTARYERVCGTSPEVHGQPSGECA